MVAVTKYDNNSPHFSQSMVLILLAIEYQL